jgi:hypothetical protein
MDKSSEQIVRELFKQHGTHLSHLRSDINEIKEDIGGEKGIKERLKQIENWRIEIKTERRILNWAWGSFGLAMMFGVYNMYIGYIKLPDTIRTEVRSAIREELPDEVSKIIKQDYENKIIYPYE